MKRRHAQPRIGYVPMDRSMTAPGDRRRFGAYARARNLVVEIADPKEIYDVVVLSEKCDPTVWCDYPYGKITYDLVDSYLAVPRMSIKTWLRGPAWYAIGRHERLRFDYRAILRNLCCRADAVVCTTEEQRNHIQSYCANVHIVLDVHDGVIRRIKDDYRSGLPFSLVWEGLPSNLPQLKIIRNVLRRVHRRTPLVLRVLTDPDRPRYLGRYGRISSIDLARSVFDKIEFYAWHEDTAADIICRSDLAVIPIDLSDPFVSGKPQNKLLLFWRLGMPVIASATAAYKRTMREANLDSFVCSTDAEWGLALERMQSDQHAREFAGKRGRFVADTYYGSDSTLAKWDAVFASIGFQFTRPVEMCR